MNTKIFLTALLMLLWTVQELSAAKVVSRCRFRSGWIMAAETSKDAPKINHLDKYFAKSLPGSIAYAAIVVRLDPKRKLTVYDYVLKKDGRSFPCIALGEAHSDYDARREISDAIEGRLYAMLFAVDASVLSSEAYTTFTLCYQLSNAGQTDLELRFVNRDRELTKISLTPEQGSLRFNLNHE